MAFQLRELQPLQDLETKEVLKKVASAHRYLAELKGVSASIPNQSILINTLLGFISRCCKFVIPVVSAIFFIMSIFKGY